MITKEFSNSTDRTAESLATQEAADRYAFEQMRQAQDEKFHSRPEWLPETSIDDDTLEDRLERQIQRSAAQIADNRRILDDTNERHESFLDEEWIRRGQF